MPDPQGVGSLSPNKVAALIYGSPAAFGPKGALVKLVDGKPVAVDPPNKDEVIRFLDVAIAVCTAESGRNPYAKNAHSSASGLWQIMVSVHGDKIAKAVKYWQVEDGRTLDIYDPRLNTHVAAMIFQEAGNKWTPWEVFNTGAYKAYLGHGAKAYEFLKDPKRIQTAYDGLMGEFEQGKATAEMAAFGMPLAAGLGSLDIPDWLGAVFEFIATGAVSVGMFVLGTVLLILGIWFLLSNTGVGKAVKGAVRKRVPV